MEPSERVDETERTVILRNRDIKSEKEPLRSLRKTRKARNILGINRLNWVSARMLWPTQQVQEFSGAHDLDRTYGLMWKVFLIPRHQHSLRLRRHFQKREIIRVG
jgi:hypothetical protein